MKLYCTRTGSPYSRIINTITLLLCAFILGLRCSVPSSYRVCPRIHVPGLAYYGGHYASNTRTLNPVVLHLWVSCKGYSGSRKSESLVRPHSYVSLYRSMSQNCKDFDRSIHVG